MNGTGTSPPQAGRPVELVRYDAPEGLRVLVGQQLGEHIQLTDRPVERQGCTYLVEAELPWPETGAVVRDYVAQAREQRDCPMRLLGAIDLEEPVQ